MRTSPLIDLFVVAGVILRNSHILAAKRREGGPSGLKWEFAGGKVESGESPQEALTRELREELGLCVAVGKELGTFSTPLGGYRIHLKCFWCTVTSGEPVLNDHLELRWCGLDELRTLDWALPDIPAVERILADWRLR